jgi:PLP dependent protein
LNSSDIKKNLEAVRFRIAQACLRSGRSIEEVTLIAVTKTEDTEVIKTAFELGLRNFGENRVQEAESKIKQLSDLQPKPTWHMIGHLQTNKLKTALDIFDTFQSVDSLNLAEAINRHTVRKIPVLIQVNVSEEATKGGFLVAGISKVIAQISLLSNLKIKGLMTIAPLVKNAEEVRPIFRKLRDLRDTLNLEHLSMGMTDDFEIAVEEGATMIRIGRALFGERL